MNELQLLQKQIKTCHNCSLCEGMPFNPVTSIGNVNSQIMIVGEAPGYDESITEEPFVGQCGRMLDKMLKEADINRSDCYICNTVNCRPTEGNKNRPPNRMEISACKTWLFKQIDLVKPRVIFTLGKIPTYTILGLKASITLNDYVGNEYQSEHKYDNAIIIPNYHPSYLMQYGKKKVDAAIEIFKKGKSLC